MSNFSKKPFLAVLGLFSSVFGQKNSVVQSDQDSSGQSRSDSPLEKKGRFEPTPYYEHTVFAHGKERFIVNGKSIISYSIPAAKRKYERFYGPLAVS